MLVLDHVTKGYDEHGDYHPVLQDVSLELNAGEHIALTGESGAGKSTLLYLCGALTQPEQGTLLFNNQEIAKWSDNKISQWRRQSLGFIFQQYNLVSGLNVADNISFLRRFNKQPANDDWTDYLIATLELAELLHRQPEQLSGGQQQRVAIARALAHRPDLVLADEPTGNLDERHSHQVMRCLIEFVNASDAALLLVTHSQQMAQYCQQRLILKEQALHVATH